MLTSRFDEAFQFAHRLHCAQTRKGTSIPYISHLMTVAALVVEHGGTRIRPSQGCCMTPRRTRAANERLAKSARRLATPLQQSWPTAPMHGSNRSRLGGRARKPILRRCRTSRRPRFWCRWPTRLTTPRPSCSTTACLAKSCGAASMAALTERVGTTARSPACFPRRCLGGCPIGCHGPSRRFRVEQRPDIRRVRRLSDLIPDQSRDRVVEQPVDILNRPIAARIADQLIDSRPERSRPAALPARPILHFDQRDRIAGGVVENI